jgi:flagellin-like hook-associated protein FlgL
MNIFRAFMELDKLHEGYDDRQTLISNLKSIGRNYNFDKYSTPQLFYIWQKESAKHNAASKVSEDDFVETKSTRATCDECGCALTDGGFCPKCDDGVEDLEESVKSEYHCSECGFTGMFYDEEVADGCCPNCHEHHGSFMKCDEALKENWADEKLAELRQKPRYAWTEEDWDDYNYCMNANAEVDYYDSLDEAAINWVSRAPIGNTQATPQVNPNQVSKMPATRYALALEEPVNKYDPVFFYFDSDDDDYTRDDLETAYEENEYCVFDTLDEALKKINKQRADLGAYQNRLELTVAGIDIAAENLQASESRIRDTDMASAMVEYTKNSVLAQAGTAMLAQANTSS